MKKLISLCAIYTICINAFKAQTFSKNPFNDSYRAFVKIAEEHYTKKEYTLAAENYLKAFVANGEGGFLFNDRIKLAGCWALAGQKDSAFNNLRVVENARFSKYNGLMLNADFNSLHDDKRWPVIMGFVKSNRIKYNAQLNIQVTEILDTVMQNDQKYRLSESGLKDKYGAKSKEIEDLQKTVHFYDSINQVRVLSILDQYGWPSSTMIGSEGSTAIFLVIQHADLKIQEKYLPFVQNAVHQKTIPPSYLALLEDRIAISKNGKQKYGTQVGTDSTGKYYLEPLTDPKSVDLRRADIGLGPLSEYLKQWDIEWPEKNK